MEFKVEDGLISLGYIFFILGLIVIYLLVLFLKNRKKHDQEITGKLKLDEKIYLEDKLKVYVIDYQDKKFIIANNGQSVAITEQVKNN